MSRAALFVDYENIFQTLDGTLDRREESVEIISEMIRALQRSLLEERETQSTVARAYADFTALSGFGDRIQRGLYMQGIEPRFVPASLQAEAVEIQLCVDAMDVLHHRPDVSTFVLLTGRRTYLPLVQTFKRSGRHVLVVGLEEPAALDEIPYLEGEWFFPAGDLLSASSRQAVPSSDARLRSTSRAPRRPPSFREITDPMLIHTLEIIEEHFGQYEEVYLTPLLRKMSEILDDRHHDPKTLVSDLEDHAAVRLEKRQGFPHDYTVLIVNDEHPDVERVLEEMRSHAPYYYEDSRSRDDSYGEDFGDEFQDDFMGDAATETHRGERYSAGAHTVDDAEVDTDPHLDDENADASRSSGNGYDPEGKFDHDEDVDVVDKR